MFYIAEFHNAHQLDFFAETVGFTYELAECKESDLFGLYREYSIDRKFEDGSFWSLEELPIGARPIKAFSNGSIVTCYYTNDGEIITIYRPNPNAKTVYSPLTIQQHIAHKQIYGSY
jgi:hypothetical protein